MAALSPMSINSSLSIPLNPLPIDALREAILDVINRTPIEDDCVNARRGMLVVAAVISGATKYFFIPASMKLPAGPLWAGGNCIGWFFLEFGFGYQFIQGLMTPKLPSEKRVIAHCELSTCAKVCIAVPSFIAGAFSQTTAALQALKYNSTSSKVAVTSITATSTGFYPTVSIQETIVDSYAWIRTKLNPPSPFEIKLHHLRHQMIRMIQCNHATFAKLSYNEKVMKVSSFSLASMKSDDDAKFESYMRLMLIPFEPRETEKKVNITNYVSGVVKTASALFFWGTSEVLGTMYTYYNVKESFNYESDAFQRGMSALYAGTSFYITWKLNRWMMDYIGGTLTCSRPQSTAERLYPFATTAFASLSLIIDILSQGAVWQIWGDFAKEKNFQDDELFFQLSQCAGTFLILFASTLGTIKVALDYYAEHRDTATFRQIIQLDHQFTKMSNLLQKSSFLHFCVHLTNFSESLKKEVIEDILNAQKITEKELREYAGIKEMNSKDQH